LGDKTPNFEYGVASFYGEGGVFLSQEIVPFPFIPTYFRAKVPLMDYFSAIGDTSDLAPTEPLITREEYRLSACWTTPQYRKDEQGRILFIPGNARYFIVKREVK
jgi:hypothetical protein